MAERENPRGVTQRHLDVEAPPKEPPSGEPPPPAAPEPVPTPPPISREPSDTALRERQRRWILERARAESAGDSPAPDEATK